jgi:hypothetical protein
MYSAVIARAREFLDENFSLQSGSHVDAISYAIEVCAVGASKVDPHDILGNQGVRGDDGVELCRREFHERARLLVISRRPDTERIHLAQTVL